MLRAAHTVIACCYTTFGRHFATHEVSNNLNNTNVLGFYHSIRENLEMPAVVKMVATLLPGIP